MSTRTQTDDEAVGAPRRPGRVLVVAGTIVLALVLAWRLTLGASAEDDGHVVALALRLSRGDSALGDEMNLQATGAFLAVPFVWAWDHAVGTTGIVLASRVWFVALAAVVAVVTARALRTRYAAGPAAVATVAALLGLPYQLPLISYSSVPVLALVLAAAAGIALRERRSSAWAAVLGVATAMGVVSSPQLAPAFALALTVGVVRVQGTRPRVVALATSGGLVAVAAAWVLLVAGPTPVADTVRYLLEVRGDGLSPLGRLGRAVGTYEMVRFPLYWPLLACLGLTAAGCVRREWRAVRVGASAGGVAWATAVTVAAALGYLPQLWFGNTVAALESLLVVILLLPVLAELHWSRRRGDIGDLVAAALPALVAATVVAATTNSGPRYSVHGAALGGLLLVLVVQWSTVAGLLVTEPRSRAIRALAALPAVAMALGLLSLPFDEPGSLRVDTRIATGPWAGLVTTADRASGITALSTTVADLTRGGRPVLLLGASGGYLAANGPMATPSVWLEDHGAANRWVLDWFARTGRTPDVVVVTAAADARAGGAAAWAGRDPLRAWLATAYPVQRVVPGVGTVLERR
ncbi:hypothetical protein [Terrabacter sp. Root181]|uniref:hypothetical protein n=1 Tax=Terrabacter sp. Root181 TaxID=1736484 RepID=UPI0006F6332E|nr:hypothetical protein [Terrabacter sp. Root181]KRB43402.1 hypothetical protein ASD90_21145 [Terrabacter sp. Root181]